MLFDGVCNLCDATVRFVLERDRLGELRFAALGTPGAERVLRAAGVTDASKLPDSVLLVDADGVHARSEAALRIARHLRAPWRWAVVFRAIPRPVRDAVYRFIARHRYRLFGVRESCRLPRPDEAERFL
ncbi:hypothetical protein Pla163_04780 [Planctomycetes bacterium Pla163]|uniref:Thiol-disulfide oxidoreductase DCC n=2 Tax=Rohdeia mirabilis TaxID=2528008 RepID=A0A518CVX7_9BACT|nr:hypothetical protein Pla163_04780 [Planctomycetes bacterium Pla163]